MEKRKRLKEKILRIHEKVYPILNKENIHCHWVKNNITSLIIPDAINFWKVSWIGVRYGKHENEVKSMMSDEFGFPKHSCLQFSINPDGFAINLFHAVRRDAVDRDYLHKNINKLKDRIITELDKLKGEGLEWVIHDNIENRDYTFKIDNERSEDFITFYKENDDEGRESYLSYFLEPDDDNLKDVNSISTIVIEKIKLLLPLYNLLAFRIK